jgi:hypothetical protein
VTIDAQDDEPAPGTSRAAAQLLDLSRSRRLVYLGGEGDVLAAFLDEWHLLGGVWIGPAEAQATASRFLDERGLGARMHYVIGDTLDAIAAGDLVVASTIDAAVESTLQLLVSAGPRWLSCEGRWLILQRETPHLSCVVGGPLLHGRGLRVVSEWSLSKGVRMLVCAPAHCILETLAEFADRPAMGCWQPATATPSS